jgi:hypothetical protein
MLRCILAIVFAISLGSIAQAQCPGGVCKRPVRSAISAIPTLAPARPHSPVVKRGQERSVVVRRGHVRGPGLFARIRFAPQSRWR